MAETVQRALEEIGPLVDGSIEVLVVDDGSTDRTPELADALAAADPRVRVHHQPNRGYGGALRAGFANASGELICFSDGDLQFDLREMARLLDRLDDTSPAGRCRSSATASSAATRRIGSSSPRPTTPSSRCSSGCGCATSTAP